MKFTKEQLSEALKAKITNNGKKNLAMSERSFNGKVERIYKRLEKASDSDDLELDDVVADLQRTVMAKRMMAMKATETKASWISCSKSSKT